MAADSKASESSKKTEAVADGAVDGIEMPTKRRKKKKKVSSAAKPFDRLDRDLSKAERRLAKAVLDGVEKWQSDSKKSSRKKRDGALRDTLKNSARAYSKLFSKASRIPGDVADLLYPYKR